MVKLGQTYSTASGDYQLICAYYYIANATDATLSQPIVYTSACEGTTTCGGASGATGTVTFNYSGPAFTNGELVAIAGTSLPSAMNNTVWPVTSSASGTVTISCGSTCSANGTVTGGVISLSGFSDTVAVAAARALGTVTVDYSNVNSVDGTPPTGFTTFSSSTSVTAPGFTATAADTVLAIFEEWGSANPDYSCPSGWNLHMLGSVIAGISPQIIVCDEQVTAGTAVSAVATMGSSGQSGSGGMIGFKPN